MPTLLILMIVAATVFAFWSAGRAAAERAEEVGRDACQAAGVQWLDQSVHAIGLKLCRHDTLAGLGTYVPLRLFHRRRRSPRRETGAPRRSTDRVQRAGDAQRGAAALTSFQGAG
jgi:hypothetical protein